MIRLDIFFKVCRCKFCRLLFWDCMHRIDNSDHLGHPYSLIKVFAVFRLRRLLMQIEKTDQPAHLCRLIIVFSVCACSKIHFYHGKYRAGNKFSKESYKITHCRIVV